MNVFILNSGRCGSTTFIEACRHIDNFTAGHESRCTQIGASRLNYPANHIEADNRLSWILGRLQRQYGDNAFYVHLQRDRGSTVSSFIRRRDFGIMKAYREGILMLDNDSYNDREIAGDYLDTVQSNIELFLDDKSHQMDFRLEHAVEDFKVFWDSIGARGHMDAALACWQQRFNASD